MVSAVLMKQESRYEDLHLLSTGLHETSISFVFHQTTVSSAKVQSLSLIRISWRRIPLAARGATPSSFEERQKKQTVQYCTSVIYCPQWLTPFEALAFILVGNWVHAVANASSLESREFNNSLDIFLKRSTPQHRPHHPELWRWQTKFS